MPDPISWSLALPYFLAAIAFGYLIGSIPFGLIFVKMAGLGDVREIGSGNVGATNVLRTGNRPVAALTLAADMLKGTVAYVVTENLCGLDMALMAGLGAFLGHCFPIWLKFKGGKGVAVYFGILIPVFLGAAAVSALIWLTIAAITRYSSLAGIITAITTPITLYGFGYAQAAEVFLLLTVILLIKHRTNIQRLACGKEGRIGGT